jgi:hypothetical protein
LGVLILEISWCLAESEISILVALTKDMFCIIV